MCYAIRPYLILYIFTCFQGAITAQLFSKVAQMSIWQQHSQDMISRSELMALISAILDIFQSFTMLYYTFGQRCFAQVQNSQLFIMWLILWSWVNFFGNPISVILCMKLICMSGSFAVYWLIIVCFSPPLIKRMWVRNSLFRGNDALKHRIFKCFWKKTRVRCSSLSPL